MFVDIIRFPGTKGQAYKYYPTYYGEKLDMLKSYRLYGSDIKLIKSLQVIGDRMYYENCLVVYQFVNPSIDKDLSFDITITIDTEKTFEKCEGTEAVSEELPVA